jgi:hypothetical protein
VAGIEPEREQFYLEGQPAQVQEYLQLVAGKEPEREQFYPEASLLQLKNIYSKWQVWNQKENSSTWRPACTSLGTSTASGRCRTIEGTVLPGSQPAQAQEYRQQVAGKESEREQVYLGAGLLKLKNIYSKWQVKNQRENSSTWRPACTSSRISTPSGRYRTSERTVLPGGQPAQGQIYLQLVAGKEPKREQFHLEASLLKLKNIYAKWQVKNQRENSSTWSPACSSSRISTASGR